MFLREPLHFFKGLLRTGIMQPGDHGYNAQCAREEYEKRHRDEIMATEGEQNREHQSDEH